MTIQKLFFSTLIAGCLAVSASFAEGKTGPSDAEKAKYEEIKAKIEVKRSHMKANHDSLSAEHKAEIQKRIAAHKADRAEDKAERDVIRAKVKVLVDEFKEKMKNTPDSLRKELEKDLGHKIHAIGAAARAAERAEFEANKKAFEGEIKNHKAEIEKKMEESKAAFEAKKKEMDAAHHAFVNANGGSVGHLPLTEAEKAAAKAKFEEWVKNHPAGALPQ